MKFLIKKKDLMYSETAPVDGSSCIETSECKNMKK